MIRSVRAAAVALALHLALTAVAAADDPSVVARKIPPNPGLSGGALATGSGTRSLWYFTGDRLWWLPGDTTTVWVHMPDPPPEFVRRSQPYMVWDPVSARVLLYGGQDEKGDRTDLWAFDPDPAPGAWTLLSKAMNPGPPLGNFAFTYDTTRNRHLLLTGMRGAPDPLGTALWEFAAAPVPAWTPVASTGLPAFNPYVQAAYDPNLDRLLTFGETTPGGDLRQVWQLDFTTGNWSLLPTTNVPNFPSYFGTIGFDPARDALFAFNGYTSDGVEPLNTSRLQFADSSTWFPILTVRPVELLFRPNLPGSLASGFDRRTKRFQLWAPEGFYEFPIGDLIVGQRRAPAETFLTRYGGYDPESRAFWFHEGTPGRMHRQSFDQPLDRSYFDIAGPAGERTNPGVAHDAIGARLLFYGGAQNGVPQADVQALVPGSPPAWETIATQGTPPPPRHDPHVVLDTRRRRLVVLEVVDDGGSPTLPYLDLAAGSPTWGRLSVQGEELLTGWRWDAVYDSLSDRILVADDSSIVVAAGAARVRAIDLSTEPATIAALPSGPGMVGTLLTLDAARRWLVQSGGVTSQLTVTDVWVLSLDAGGDWRLLSVIGSPPPSGVREGLGAYDPVSDRIVTLGGSMCFGLGGHTGGCDPAHGMTYQFDDGTPTRLDVADASVVDGAIRVRFAGEGSSGAVRVDRSADRGSSWDDVGEAMEITPGTWEFVDATAPAGTAVRYRGRYDVGGVERTTSMTADLTLPAAGGAGTISLRARAGAIVHAWPVEFEVRLPGAGPAVLELVDVTGRVVARQSIAGGVAAASNTVMLTPDRAVGAGLYFARLRQAEAIAGARIVKL